MFMDYYLCLMDIVCLMDKYRSDIYARVLLDFLALHVNLH